MYHVLNRAVARLPLFEKDGDYQAFERVLLEAMIKQPTRLLAYSLMPNHWHLVLKKKKRGRSSFFLRRFQRRDRIVFDSEEEKGTQLELRPLYFSGSCRAAAGSTVRRRQR